MRRKSFGDGISLVHIVSYIINKVKFLLILSAVLTVITLVCVVFDIDAYGDVIGFLSLSL